MNLRKYVILTDAVKNHKEGLMRYTIEQKEDFCLIHNENGAELGIGADTPVIEEDGYAFKDLARCGRLLPYEDWRLDPDTRARDLAGRLSKEEIAGLMLYSAHQLVPFRSGGNFQAHYGGKSFEESDAEPWELTDEQISFLKNDHIRHVLQMRVDDAAISARWSNAMQRLCEAERWGIPVNISSDPRHGASAAGAEFRTAGSDVSKWPEGIGLAAAGDPELVRQFAKVMAKEYRALGITTALGPQIDLSTEPRWMRLEDTLGSDPEKVTELTRAFVDGLQTTDGAPDGWGKDSVIGMVKHWPGGGTGEGGRDAHYPFGCYAVYPGGHFEEHLKPFTEGAFKLDGPTRSAGAVMPYYTVSWNADIKDHEQVGNSYNHYILHDLLREKYAYDGVVCTDWGITGDPLPDVDSFSPRCYGVENLSVAQRHLRIIMNGADQFGGNNEIGPVLEAWKIGEEQYGEEFMRERMEISAARLLRGIFRVGLFENPYLDPEESSNIVGNAQFVKAGLEAQAKSMVLLKNRAQVLPLQKGIKVYIPDRILRRHQVFFLAWTEGSVQRPLAQTDTGKWFVRTDTPEDADAAIVIMESPQSKGYSAEDAAAGGNGYLPVLLQYRPYTAVAAREVSIAGGSFREDFTNRSYRGKTNTCWNEADLDALEQTRKAMGDKPVIVVMHLHNPAVPSEWEPLADAVIAHFGISPEAMMDVIFGDAKAGGHLPYNLPKDMEAVELHDEDDPAGPAPYVTADHQVWECGYSM